MKKFVAMFALAATMFVAFGSIYSASADAHKDRFRRDCASGARKC